MRAERGSAPTFWAAPELAKAGYPVFPISPKTKRPSVEGGFYAATTDLSEIARWIGEEDRGDHLIAFATGLPSGVVVIDADSEEAAGRMRRDHGPEHVRSRRGGHWYFSHPKNGKVTSHPLGDGLDCKADGGYVLAPPGGGKVWADGIPQRSELSALPEEFNVKASPADLVAGEDLDEGTIGEAARIVARRIHALTEGRHEHMLAMCGMLLSRSVSPASTEKIMMLAWEAVGGELAERAAREIHGAVDATARNLAADLPTSGRGKAEEATPGIYDELVDVLGWHGPEIRVGSARLLAAKPGGAGEEKRHRKLSGASHAGYRDAYLETHPHVYYSRDDWYVYGKGFYSVVHEEVIRRGISRVIERDPKAKLTSGLVSSVLSLVRSERYVGGHVWNKDDDLIVLANGTLVVSTRTLRDHDPADMATHAVGYAYDPDARADVFLAALQAGCREEAAYLQEYAGLCLTPDTAFEEAVWLLGQPGAGKSTLIEAFRAMLGQKVGVLGLQEIVNSRFALGNVVGKNLLISSEQPAAHLSATSTIDALLSGELITVERKNKDPEDVVPTAKLLWAMNDLPRVTNTTSGLFRRVKIIEMQPIPEGRRLPDVKRRVQQEGSGVLNWALDGLERLRRNGGFTRPESIIKASRAFQESNDLPAQFLDERCVRDETGEIRGITLYQEYAEWCRERGHQPAAINRVGADWKRLGLAKHPDNNKRAWVGVRLKSSEDYS